jgi:hypothetical protein
MQQRHLILMRTGGPAQPRILPPEKGMVTAGARVRRRPQRAWLPDALIAATIVALVLLAAVACTGGSGPSSASPGGSPAAGGSAAAPSAVGYSHCLRSHGVPGYPDPPSGGQVPKADPQHLGVSGAQLQAAQRSCAYQYPGNGGALGASLRQCEETGNCPQAMVHQVMNSMLSFSRCIRAHGVLNWPDPTIDAEGRPGFNLVPVHGTNWNSPQIQNKTYQCEHLMPAGGGIPAIYPGAPG